MPYISPTEPCVNKMKWEYFCKFSAVCLLQLHRAQKRKHYFEQSKPLLTALFCLFFEILGIYECGLDYRLTWSSLIHYRKFLYKIILCKIVCKLAGGALNVQFYSSRVGLNMYPLATSKYIVYLNCMFLLQLTFQQSKYLLQVVWRQFQDHQLIRLVITA